MGLKLEAQITSNRLSIEGLPRISLPIRALLLTLQIEAPNEDFLILGVLRQRQVEQIVRIVQKLFSILIDNNIRLLTSLKVVSQLQLLEFRLLVMQVLQLSKTVYDSFFIELDKIILIRLSLNQVDILQEWERQQVKGAWIKRRLTKLILATTGVISDRFD